MPHLSEIQRRHLHDGLAHLEKLLDGMQTLLDAAQRPALFPRYRDDLGAPERERLARGLTAARAAIADGLRQFELAPEPASLSAAAALHAQVGVAEMAAEELAARDMRGYGPLAPEAAAALDAMAEHLRAVMAAILTGGSVSRPATDLADALAAATDQALAAMARALAAAVSENNAASEALPLIATDALTGVAQTICRAHGAAPPPELEAGGIRWRLDRPKLAGLGLDFLTTRFHRQLEPRRDEIRETLRAYGRRASAQ